MTNYRRGVYYERKIQAELGEQGYSTLRTAGSHGPFDIIAFNESEVRFIQCKATKKKTISYKSYKKDIDTIAKEKVPVYATKELWIYSKGGVHRIWIM